MMVAVVELQQVVQNAVNNASKHQGTKAKEDEWVK